MADVLIFGAGGLGRMVEDLLRRAGQHRPVAYLDSDPAKRGLRIGDVPVLGDRHDIPALRRRGVTGAVVAIGDNATRIELAAELERCGLRLVSAIHPLVSISPTARIGPHAVIGPRTSVCVHARIGAHAILSAGCIVDHDTTLGDAVMLYPASRLAGGVTIEDLATIGIGACVIPGRRVGRGAIVEPGAVVIRDVPSGVRVGGVPAQVRADFEPHFVPEQPACADAAAFVG